MLSPFVRNAWKVFQVAGVGGVPANAVAITGNLTVDRSDLRLALLTVGPDAAVGAHELDVERSPRATSRANNVTMPLSRRPVGWLARVMGTDGSKAHLILDVTGLLPARRGGGDIRRAWVRSA